MKNMLMLAFVIFAGWKFYNDSQVKVTKPEPQVTRTVPSKRATKASPPQPKFSCDGRQHCSQMSSCAEATYFIQHCPNTKMDGDRDGIPCERQWCG
ncbi:hypothetical protein NBRC116592_18130 [Colwellia sp. KU-HH00111]|uniref:excalibur calcium-binding domain-containing protein n=1 Tax=Colwellia sp. KU-HH00111 TaxID=3127652 RepID=UPI003104C68A